MKVDGGKNLTSSGFVPWYGIEHMNRRFEPDFMSNLNMWMKKGKDKISKSKHKPGTEEWIAEVQTSNWATHNEDAHFKVTQEYKSQQMNDDEVEHYMNMKKEGGVENPKQARRI